MMDPLPKIFARRARLSIAAIFSALVLTCAAVAAFHAAAGRAEPQVVRIHVPVSEIVPQTVSTAGNDMPRFSR
jgi:hypothetical protein